MRQRWWAGMLVALEAVTMAHLSNMHEDVLWYWWDTLLFPALVVLAMVLAVLRIPRWNPSAIAFRRVVGLLAGLSLAKYLLAPHEYNFFSLFLFSSFAHATAGFLVLLQVALAWRQSSQVRLPSWYVALAAVVMICVADVQVSEQQRADFEWLSAAFALTAALFLGSGHTRTQPRARGRMVRVIAATSVLAIAGFLGITGGRALFHYTRNFEGLLQPAQQGGPGSRWQAEATRRRLGRRPFDRRGNDLEIMLRVYSQQPPGYLKVAAFDRFDASTWNAAPAVRRLGQVETVPAPLETPRDLRPVFQIYPETPDNGRVLTLWPARELASQVPLVPGTTHVRLAAEEVAGNSDGVLVAENLPPQYPLSLLVSRTRLLTSPPSPSDRTRLTSLSESTPPVARQLAAELFSDCRNDREKIEAVENYFQTKHEYRLGAEIPANRDPLTWFLEQHGAAHCEFFATAATVLLRAGDVPCRYVTGFVVAERNEYGKYWVTRRKDAHAWVEAFDADQGWVTVEATPASGVPRPTTPTEANPLWESIRDRVQMQRIEWQEAGWIAVVALVLEFLATIPGLVLVVAVLVLLIRWSWKKRRPHRRRTRPDPVLRELSRLLTRMDARLARQSMVRPPQETLHQFADRLGPHLAADWYRRYAQTRYSGEVTSKTIRELALALHQH